MMNWLSANGIWIVLVAFALWMHLRMHGGHGGHGGPGGCGGGHQHHETASGPEERHEHSADRSPEPGSERRDW